MISMVIALVPSSIQAQTTTPGTSGVVDEVAILAGATTNDFDALPQGSYLGTSILIGAVTYSTPNDTLVTSLTTVSSPPNSFSAHVVSSPPPPGGDFSGDVVMEYGVDTCAFDLEILMINPPFAATAFANDGSTLTTITSSGPFTELFTFTGFPVHRVVMTGTFYAIDDVSFTEVSCIGVGGKMIPIYSTSLLLAGAQMNAAWMIPVILSGIGFAIVILRKF